MKKIDNKYPSYDELIESFEVEVLLEGHFGDYQGDSAYLLRQGDEYGILIFGWGSCSGCDALEACYGNLQELTMLRDDLYSSITWRERGAMVEYLTSKDFSLEWYGYARDWKNFEASLLAFFN